MCRPLCLPERMEETMVTTGRLLLRAESDRMRDTLPVAVVCNSDESFTTKSLEANPFRCVAPQFRRRYTEAHGLLCSLFAAMWCDVNQRAMTGSQ